MKNFILFLTTSFIIVGTGNISVGSPGAFYVSNFTSCTLTAVVYAFNGGCGAVDCGSGSVGNSGGVAVPPNQSVNIAAGYSGSGDVWGYASAWITGPTFTDGDASCFSQGGSNQCDATARYVYWDSCNSAHVN